MNEIVDLCKKHTLYSWTATEKVAPMAIERAEGVYFWTFDGKRYLDFISQMISVNIGHSHPKVIAAMQEALQGLIYANAGAATAARATLGKKLAELMPGDLNTTFFTLGGADANENAIRMARHYTGRTKILSRYRAYHGGTANALQMTGDPRRIHNEPGPWGFIHVIDPLPRTGALGQTDEEIIATSLRCIEEVIVCEGPETIAAMFVEPIPGINGVLVPPKGYLSQLAQLLKRYDILLACDEVMTGFGRTGRMFAFEHEDVLPDMVTMAKGLTSSYIPLGAVGVRDHIADHFRKNTLWGGMTYHGHPLALATASAVLDVLVEEGMVNNSAQLGIQLKETLSGLQQKHPCVRQVRSIGLFAALDLQKDAQGTPLSTFREGPCEDAKALLKAIRSRGLHAAIKWSMVVLAPPLCINAEQLQEGLQILDEALGELDARLFG